MEMVKMVRFWRTLLFAALIASIVTTPVLAQASRNDEVRLMIIEHMPNHGKGSAQVYAIPSEDDSMTNPDYVLLGFSWHTTAKYWMNPSNKYGFGADAVVTVVKTSADNWDSQTGAVVFSYQGITSKAAGTYDGYNVIAWGAYRAGVIAVTYIWYIGTQIIETDTRMNKLYKWSLTGEAGKMDVQNIMTHEFGHWAGLDDLYADKDYWLTMYGYSGYGETYKRTLGLGDILGLLAVYGP